MQEEATDMVKRLLGLAAVTGLAGIVLAASASGCSTTEIVQQPIADSGQAEVRSPTLNPDASESQIPTCELPVPSNLDSIPYEPPTIAAGACSQADITSVESLISSNPSATFADILKTLQASANKGCAACVFGPDTDAGPAPTTWPAIVLLTTNDANQTAVPVTGGGCMQIISGNQNCGKAFDEYYFCLNYVCSACSSQTEFDTCGNDATTPTGACAPAIQSMQQACGTNFSTYLDTCFPQADPADFIGSMRAQCVAGGAGISDAGHD
jgi:hypothetical protein